MSVPLVYVVVLLIILVILLMVIVFVLLRRRISFSKYDSSIKISDELSELDSEITHDNSMLKQLKQKCDDLENEKNTLKINNTELTTSIRCKEEEHLKVYDGYKNDKAGLQSKIDELQDKNSKLDGEKHALEIDNSNLKLQLGHVETACEEEGQRHKKELEKFEEWHKEEREKQELHFKDVANKILADSLSTLRKDSSKELDVIIKPFKESLSDFRSKIDSSFGEQAKEQRSLKDEINRIVMSNEKITIQAENLANALKGDSKYQGNWGEYILQNILEESGLRKDSDYYLQYVMKGDDDIGKQIPDVIIKLPEDKHIVVDAKVSLTHYEAFCSSDNKDISSDNLKKFVASVRRHINELSGKQYHSARELSTPDFVLMFMPIEAAYMLAMQEGKDLHKIAWEKRIVIVCPTTLFATLRTVSCVWRIERQNKNAEEIARQGGLLYDKIAAFVEDMVKLGEQIEKTRTTYDDLYKRLSSGKGNILSRTDKLRELGSKTNRLLPIGDLED